MRDAAAVLHGAGRGVYLSVAGRSAAGLVCLLDVELRKVVDLPSMWGVTLLFEKQLFKG